MPIEILMTVQICASSCSGIVFGQWPYCFFFKLDEPIENVLTKTFEIKRQSTIYIFRQNKTDKGRDHLISTVNFCLVDFDVLPISLQILILKGLIHQSLLNNFWIFWNANDQTILFSFGKKTFLYVSLGYAMDDRYF